jgi:hypothetical protein
MTPYVALQMLQIPENSLAEGATELLYYRQNSVICLSDGSAYGWCIHTSPADLNPQTDIQRDWL